MASSNKKLLSSADDEMMINEREILIALEATSWRCLTRGSLQWLTERLIAVHDFGREKGSRCHCLLNAFHLVWLIANQPRRYRIVTRLYRTGTGYCYVEHGAVCSLEATFLSLVQTVRNGVHLRRVAASSWILWPLKNINCAWVN